MMSEPSELSEWQTPRLFEKRHAVHRVEAEGPFDAEGKLMLPAAVVHPYSTGENPSDNISADFLRRPHLRSLNVPSPYLLGSQGASSTTPAQDIVRRPSPKSQELRRSFTSSQEIELQSLRCQVQEIQKQLNGDILGSKEYKVLLSEKLLLESALGSTEHELQELREAFGTSERNAIQAEEKMSWKMTDMMEKQQVLLDKYNKTAEELMRLKEYLQNIPTQEEHKQLEQQLSKQSSYITRLTDKITILFDQLKDQKARKVQLEHANNALRQENEDLSVKLKLTENVLSDIESQKALALEEGEDSKEDLLWRIDQLEKEFNSAKKLLTYRKQKLENVNMELIDQERKFSEKMQKEIEAGETMKEKVWELQRDLEEYKTREQMMKTLVKKSEEQQKKLEEHLEVSLGQIKNHQEMNFTITSLFTNLHKAVCTLKDLVTVSQQISQGLSPDLSVLLSFTKFREEGEGGVVSLENMKIRLKEVRQLLQQLEDIRSALQDQHAKQEASNLTCAQM